METAVMNKRPATGPADEPAEKIPYREIGEKTTSSSEKRTLSVDFA